MVDVRSEFKGTFAQLNIALKAAHAVFDASEAGSSQRDQASVVLSSISLALQEYDAAVERVRRLTDPNFTGDF